MAMTVACPAVLVAATLLVFSLTGNGLLVGYFMALVPFDEVFPIASRDRGD
jgi:hypothetical protein